MRALAGLGCTSFNFFVLASRYMNKIWVFKRKQRSRERVKRHYYYFSYLLLPNKNSFCVRINKNITRCCCSRARARAYSLSLSASLCEQKTKGFWALQTRLLQRELQVFEWSGARREWERFHLFARKGSSSHEQVVFVQSGTKVRIKICKTQLN